MFKALVIENDEQGYRHMLKDLPKNNCPIRMSRSKSATTLNYKDALAICNKGPIVRHSQWYQASILLAG